MPPVNDLMDRVTDWWNRVDERLRIVVLVVVMGLFALWATDPAANSARGLVGPQPWAPNSMNVTTPAPRP